MGGFPLYAWSKCDQRATKIVESAAMLFMLTVRPGLQSVAVSPLPRLLALEYLSPASCTPQVGHRWAAHWQQADIDLDPKACPHWYTATAICTCTDYSQAAVL